MNAKLARILTLAGLLCSALLTLGAHGPAAAAAPMKASYYYDFDQTLNPWTALAQSSVTLSGQDSACSGATGILPYGSALVTAGSATANPQAGIAAMMAKFPSDGDDFVAVEFTAQALPSCPAGCAPQVYVGGSAPANADLAGLTGDLPAKSWKTYSYTTVVKGSQTLYVALGVGGSSIMDRQPADNPAALIDCVNIRVTPIIK